MSSGFDVPTSQEIMFRSRLNCEARLEGCQGRGSHLHHRKLRSSGDHTVVNGLHVCGRCHQTIHVPPVRAAKSFAYGHGLLVHRWDDPATIPVHAGCPLECELDHVGVDSLTEQD